MLPTVSLTDHAMKDYTHNIVVKFVAHTHSVEYCTHVDDPTKPDLVDIRKRFLDTLHLLTDAPTYYDTCGVTWSDDF